MPIDRYSDLSARDIARGVRTGAFTAREVTAAAFAALERVEPTIRAFVTLARDEAFAVAGRIDARIAAGQPVGPLAGVPVAVKDLVLTRGLRTTFGSRLYADFIPDEDDIIVARLRAAGAIVIGKTNASEFGFGAHGNNLLFPTTGNPWNPDLGPGGSSAGSAAAVAAGVCPIAVGSDGGGSIRIPAALCGLVGVKASMGRVPLWPGCRDAALPGASGWESIEHVGPIARTVADAALMLSVIAGPDPRDRWSLPSGDVDWTDLAPPPRGLRAAFWPTWGGAPIDPDVLATTEAAVRGLAAAIGLTLVDVPQPTLAIAAAFQTIIALETDLAGLRRLADGRRQEVTPAVAAILDTSLPFEAATDAITIRKAFADQMARIMADVDVLLTPTLPVTAFDKYLEGPPAIGGVAVGPADWSPCTFPFNLTGQPAASVPAGFARGLPVGLQIVGPHLGDARVLRVAAAMEAAMPLSARPTIYA